MKVVVHPADMHGCGAYRMIWPANALADQGYNVTVEVDRTYKARWRSTHFGERIEAIAQPVDADVIVLQRPLHRNRYELLVALKAKGVKVVVEIDDNFHAIHPGNPAWKGANPLSDPDVSNRWLQKSCDIADLVTCTTPALAEQYGAHGRVAVLPNYVPAWYLEVGGLVGDGDRDRGSVASGESRTVPSGRRDQAAVRRQLPRGSSRHEHPRSRGHAGDGAPGRRAGEDESGDRSNQLVTIGWSGSVATHPKDLDQTQGAVAEAVLASDASFHVIGTGKGVKKGLGLLEHPSSTGWLPLDEYPRALAALDVGIVPLRPSAFNESKSALKMMELAAVGAVPIGTPTTDNRRMHARGVGLLAETRDDWYTNVYKLATDQTLRSELAASSKEAMRGFTIEERAKDWWEAWASI